MGSLTSCMKKAGAALHAEDRALILAASAGHRKKGMKANDSAKMAVADAIEAVRKQIEDRQAALAEAEKPAAEKLAAEPVAENATTEAPTKIDDVGEKIGSARKDTAESEDTKAKKEATDEVGDVALVSKSDAPIASDVPPSVNPTAAEVSTLEQDDGAINESRRRNEMDALAQERRALGKIIDALSPDAFEGKTITQQVQVADTGKTATLRMDAGQALRDVNEREAALLKLKACMGR